MAFNCQTKLWSEWYFKIRGSPNAYTDTGFNLSTIYPELYDDLQQLRQFVPTNRPERPEYVLGIHFSEESFRNLQDFVDFDFDNDFYGHILHIGRLKSQSVELNEKINRKGRSYIKRHVMSFLFERNDDFRTDNLVIEKIQSLFPELTEFIERFLSYYGNSKFSYLLQRTESYLILDKVCGYLNRHHPEIPFYTIHDSILTPNRYSTTVQDVMKAEIFRITGKRPQVSIKQELKELDIEEVWGKVKISTPKKLEKVRYSILKNNITKGVSLIDNLELKTHVKGVIKPWMSNY